MSSYSNVNKSIKIDIIEQLKNNIPAIFEDGRINLNLLKELFEGNIIQNENDTFFFNWANKKINYNLIQTPTYTTLKPIFSKSINFDNTENIILMGENSDCLKLLFKSYFSKIDMIYIDPPYNTGKDFIYRDNRYLDEIDYLKYTAQIDSEGKKLSTNNETNGRFHSDWLNFMYIRLYISRYLLTDKGVIFVSIDDNEMHNLRKILDEIFGEENFIATLIRKSGIAPRQDAKLIANQHDYVICYAKNINKVRINRKPSEAEGFILEDDHVVERGKHRLNKLDRGSIRYSDKMDYPIITPDGTDIWPGGDPNDKKWTWRWSPKKVQWGLENDYIVFKQIKNNKWSIYYKEYELVDNNGNKRNRFNPYSSLILDAHNEKGNKEISAIFNERVFDYPKPIDLLQHLIKIATDENSIVLDFFAGSGTTGHAVWEQNIQDDGDRKFILINIDEEVKDTTLAEKYPTVADICVERIARVSKYYNDNYVEMEKDFGFKVFQLSPSNFNLKNEFSSHDGEDKEKLKNEYLNWLGLWINEPLVKSWIPEDVIYEIILKEGMDLNSKLEKIMIGDNSFFLVKEINEILDFYISLDDIITDKTIEVLSRDEYRNKKFFVLDKAISDSNKINLSRYITLKVI